MFIRTKRREGKKSVNYSFYCVVTKDKIRKDIFLFSIKREELLKDTTDVSIEDMFNLYNSKITPVTSEVLDSIYCATNYSVTRLIRLEIDKLRDILKTEEKERLRKLEEEEDLKRRREDARRKAKEKEDWENAKFRYKNNGGTKSGTLNILYELSEVEQELLRQMLKEGYKKLAQKYHPDKGHQKGAQIMILLNNLKDKLDI